MKGKLSLWVYSLLVFFFALNTTTGFTQEGEIGYLQIYGLVEEDKTPVKNANVEVYNKNSLVNTENTNNKGKFELKLDFGNEYLIKVVKDGYLPSKYYVETKLTKDDYKYWAYGFEIIAELIPDVEGLDKSLFPGREIYINFDNRYEEFIVNLAKTGNAIERNNRLKNQAEEIIKNTQKYNKEIAEADMLYKSEYYEKAIDAYEKASEYLSFKQYPKDQIKEIRAFLEARRDLEKNYKRYIAQADRAFNSLQYENAREDYMKASKLKPQEQYPKVQIQKIDLLLKEQAEKQKAYDEAIALADQQFSTKDYTDAKNNYQRASNIFPGNPYPRDQISKINSILSNNLQQQEAYDKAIAEANRNYNSENYGVAKKYYQEALGIFPDQQFPKDRIAEINKKLAEMQDQQAAYDQAIAEADQAFDSQQYVNAKNAYQRALSIFHDKKYPRDRLNEVLAILAKLQNRQEAYDNFIAEADDAFGQKKYELAKNYYQQALQVYPDKPYPQGQIAKINKILSDIEQRNTAYNSAIQRADYLFNSKEYAAARDKYKEASIIKPEKQYPKDRINEINKILSEKQSKQQAYDDAIAQADNYFNQEAYQDAKSSYQVALTIFDRQYPKDKINEINSILAEMKKQQEAYDNAIAQADEHFNLKEYKDAITYYQAALNIFPKKEYPKNRIEEINRLLSALKNKNEAYQKAIAEADQYFNQKQWEEAKSSYQDASNIFPQKQYPKDRIKEIDQLLATMLSKKQAYEKAIKEGDFAFNQQKYTASIGAYKRALEIYPEKEYPKKRIAEIQILLEQLKKKEAAYKQAIAEGNQQFDDKAYESAKASFQKALNLFDRAYPKQKLAEINDILAKQLNQQQAYDKAIAEADKALSEKKYQLAKSSYESAMRIFPNEEYPPAQIAKINQILAEIDQRNKQYDELVLKGDNAFAVNNYQEAKGFFTSASQLKPNEQYPKDKIKQINQILLEQQQQQQSYDQAIAQADMAFNNKEYNPAKSLYQKALNIFPKKAYPAQKIAEINQILSNLQSKEENYKRIISDADQLYNIREYVKAKTAYEEALALFPNKEYPQNQVKKINSILQEMQAKQLAYNNAIKQADNAFNAQQYQQAIDFYKKATSILPGKQYPKDRVLEAEKLLAGAKKRRKYQEQITLGDNNFNNKNYTGALTNYQAASQIYPDEQYPKNKIDEINTILKNLENKQQAYDEAIAEADEAFNSEIYDKAKIQYNSALGIFPDKQYPKEQIKKINQKLAELQKINKAYNAAIVSADKAFDNSNYEQAKQHYTQASNLKPNEQYPKDRLAQITQFQEEAKQKQKAYDIAIAEGDKAYNNAAYEKAKAAYENALAIFPNETYPQTRLKEINQIISSRQGKEQAYRKAVQQGDKYLRSNAYNQAIKSYEYALKIDPTKQYPKDKISEVKRIMEDEKALAKFYAQGYLDVAGKTTIPKNKSEKFKFMAFHQHKSGSYATIKIKNLSTRDLNIFLNYGKGVVKNGGFTFKIAASDNAKQYKIDLSKHSQWIIERNNWISLYPAGGSVEIQDIKIHFGK